MLTERPKDAAFPKWYRATTGGTIYVPTLATWDYLTGNGTLDSAFTETTEPAIPAFTTPDVVSTPDPLDGIDAPEPDPKPAKAAKS